MNLQTELDIKLWNAVRGKYETQDFTGAILDSIHLLTDLIREKAGLEGDGVSLVGQAFGGESPKLKVNRLQTQSEKDIQKGIEQILRGLFQAIRNPRSHDKYNDVKVDADTIILFVNYLLLMIGESKPPFCRE